MQCETGGGGWGPGPSIDIHLPPSTFTGNFKKSQYLGFGVFIDKAVGETRDR
jgi:hypothetical protein